MDLVSVLVLRLLNVHGQELAVGNNKVVGFIGDEDVVVSEVDGRATAREREVAVPAVVSEDGAGNPGRGVMNAMLVVSGKNKQRVAAVGITGVAYVDEGGLAGGRLEALHWRLEIEGRRDGDRANTGTSIVSVAET